MSIRLWAPGCAAGVCVLAALMVVDGAEPDAVRSAPAAPRTGSEYRIIGAGITGASQLMPTAGQNQSRLELVCSDADMAKAFDWAKRQAMAYARDEGDPVGPWIE